MANLASWELLIYEKELVWTSYYISGSLLFSPSTVIDNSLLLERALGLLNMYSCDVFAMA